MAITKILVDDELKKKMGLTGYHNVLDNYIGEIITSKINEIYADIM